MKSELATSAERCRCPPTVGFDDPFYAPDACPCGERRHHFHCSACRGVAEVC